jgi:hypothetical protein
MADLAQLQQQRKQIIAEIQRRGGKDKAPGFAQKLQQIDAQIRALRQGEQPAQQGPTTGQSKQTQQEIFAQNPTQYNTPFGSQNVTVDANGNPIVNQSLAAGQQGIADADTRISQAGRNFALSMLQNPQGLINRQSSGDLLQDRQRIEEDIYGRLTRDVDSNEQRARQQAEQDLYNKGIEFNPDPNSRYQQELKMVTDRFDRLRQDARSQAIQMGGQEWERSFNIGETTNANNLNYLGQFSNLGPGLRAPNLPGYNPVSNVPFAQLKQEGQQFKTQAQIEREKIQASLRAAAMRSQPGPAQPESIYEGA